MDEGPNIIEQPLIQSESSPALLLRRASLSSQHGAAFFSYCIVAMVRTVFWLAHIVVDAVRCRQTASVRGVTKAAEIVSSQNR